MAQKTGNDLLAGLRSHLAEYQASPDFVLSLGPEESVETIREVCLLRAGRGPIPFLSLDQDECAARVPGLPLEVDLDVDVTASVLRRRQLPWTLPPQTCCLSVWGELPTIEWSRLKRTQVPVRGRHAFGSLQKLERIDLSNLDLTRGRLDLSKIAACEFMELFNCTFGMGDFGLRWPSQVNALRLVNCTFVDQTLTFELPQGLTSLDISTTTLASLAPNWSLPDTLTYLDVARSPMAGKALPTLLPSTLKDLSCHPEHFPIELKAQVFPVGINKISLSKFDNDGKNFQRFKLMKRNWAREIKKDHPNAHVSIT